MKYYDWVKIENIENRFKVRGINYMNDGIKILSDNDLFELYDILHIKETFDLEQDIFKCWHLVDDIDQVAELVLDRDASKDTVSNILIGLSALYGDRFQKLMDNFEELIANEKI